MKLSELLWLFESSSRHHVLESSDGVCGLAALETPPCGEPKRRSGAAAGGAMSGGAPDAVLLPGVVWEGCTTRKAAGACRTPSASRLPFAASKPQLDGTFHIRFII